MLRPASLIGPVAALRHQAFKAQAAGGTEQVGADLTLLERIDEDAFRPACQQPPKVGLAERQRQFAQSVHQRAVPAPDGRSRHPLQHEPCWQRLGQCGDGELLLLLKTERTASRTKDGRRYIYARAWTSITEAMRGPDQVLLPRAATAELALWRRAARGSLI